MHDYLWRWDTDWFWCSRAFGAQHPLLRRLWPARYRRSDVYHRLVGLEHRYGSPPGSTAAQGRPARERVVQDVEIPVGADRRVPALVPRARPMTPIWLCPLRLRSPADRSATCRTASAVAAVPAADRRDATSTSASGAPCRSQPGDADGDVNRAIEDAVAELDGHKSLYSDAYYDRETFDAIYGGEVYRS